LSVAGDLCADPHFGFGHPIVQNDASHCIVIIYLRAEKINMGERHKGVYRTKFSKPRGRSRHLWSLPREKGLWTTVYARSFPTQAFATPLSSFPRRICAGADSPCMTSRNNRI
jgi:hypothetical protein